MFDQHAGNLGIRGIGVDLCAVPRMAALLTDDRFLDRYFTPGEKAYIRGKGQEAAQTMAGIFAAKEAALKALGTGVTRPLQSVEVTHTAAGAPQLTLHPHPPDCTFHLSIAHEGELTVAFVVCAGVKSVDSSGV